MKSPSAILVLLSLLLSAIAIESRNGPAEEYWKSVMKDQPMPEAIHGLVHSDNSNQKPKDCHENVKTFVHEFKPIPQVSAYNNDDVGPKDHKPFVKDFKPIPEVSVYNE